MRHEPTRAAASRRERGISCSNASALATKRSLDALQSTSSLGRSPTIEGREFRGPVCRADGSFVGRNTRDFKLWDKIGLTCFCIGRPSSSVLQPGNLKGNVSLTAGVVAHDGVRRRSDAPRRRRRRCRGHTSVAPRSGTARTLIGQTLKNWSVHLPKIRGTAFISELSDSQISIFMVCL